MTLDRKEVCTVVASVAAAVVLLASIVAVMLFCVLGLGMFWLVPGPEPDASWMQALTWICFVVTVVGILYLSRVIGERLCKRPPSEPQD